MWSNAKPTDLAPSAPPDDPDDDMFSRPIAHPVAYYDSSQALPSSNSSAPSIPFAVVYQSPSLIEQDDTASTSTSTTIIAFLTSSLQLTVFHVLNFVLGVVAFHAVLIGAIVSAALLPLCCFGIVAFRMLFALVNDFARADVALHDWIVPPAESIHLGDGGLRQPNWLTLADPGNRASSAHLLNSRSTQSTSTRERPLVHSLYFLTVKFALAFFSAFAVGFTFAYPVTTFSVVGMRATFFSNVFGTVGFALLTMFLVVLGTAFMKFSAGISCAITRYVCGNKSQEHHTSQHPQYQVAVSTGTTYGAFRQVTSPREDRVLI